MVVNFQQDFVVNQKGPFQWKKGNPKPKFGIFFLLSHKGNYYLHDDLQQHDIQIVILLLCYSIGRSFYLSTGDSSSAFEVTPEQQFQCQLKVLRAYRIFKHTVNRCCHSATQCLMCCKILTSFRFHADFHFVMPTLGYLSCGTSKTTILPNQSITTLLSQYLLHMTREYDAQKPQCGDDNDNIEWLISGSFSLQTVTLLSACSVERLNTCNKKKN